MLLSNRLRRLLALTVLLTFFSLFFASACAQVRREEMITLPFGRPFSAEMKGVLCNRSQDAESYFLAEVAAYYRGASQEEIRKESDIIQARHMATGRCTHFTGWVNLTIVSVHLEARLHERVTLISLAMDGVSGEMYGIVRIVAVAKMRARHASYVN